MFPSKVIIYGKERSAQNCGILDVFTRLLQLKVIAVATMAGILGLQAAQAQIQPMGIVRPNQAGAQPTPQADAVTTGNGIEYHGGPVMQQKSQTYAIFWEPPTLQDGTSTVSPFVVLN